jgi:hypothetical protein
MTCDACGHGPHPSGRCKHVVEAFLYFHEKSCICFIYIHYYERFRTEPEMPVFCGAPCLDFYDKQMDGGLVHPAPDQGRLEEMVRIQGPFCYACGFQYALLPDDRILGEWGLPSVETRARESRERTEERRRKLAEENDHA